MPMYPFSQQTPKVERSSFIRNPDSVDPYMPMYDNVESVGGPLHESQQYLPQRRPEHPGPLRQPNPYLLQYFIGDKKQSFENQFHSQFGSPVPPQSEVF